MDGTEVWAYYYPRLLFQRYFCSYVLQSMSIIPSSSVGIIHGVLNRYAGRVSARTLGRATGTMTSLSRALGSALARQAGTAIRQRVFTAMRNYLNEIPNFLLTPRAGLRGMRRARTPAPPSQGSGPASQYASPSFTFSLPPSQPRYVPRVGGMRLLPIYRAINLDRRRRYRRRRSRRSRR